MKGTAEHENNLAMAHTWRRVWLALIERRRDVSVRWMLKYQSLERVDLSAAHVWRDQHWSMFESVGAIHTAKIGYADAMRSFYLAMAEGHAGRVAIHKERAQNYVDKIRSEGPISVATIEEVLA